MAFIDYIEHDDAPEELQALYKKYGGPNRTPSNIVRIAGPNPPVLEAHVGFYRAIMMGKSSLTRAQREMIATFISGLNQCHY